MNNDVFRSIQIRQYGPTGKTHIYSSVFSDKNILQRLRLEKKLEAHRGCVNSICWNETGEHILSGSDDQHLVISNPFTGKEVVSMRSGHRANIFSARYIPFSSDSKVVSCSGDGKIYLTEVFREETYANNLFNCHVGTAYEILTVPNEASTFFSCGEDGTVRWFDLRVKSRCLEENCKQDVLINCKRAVTAMAINPMVPYHLALSSSDGKIKIYDRRMLGTEATGNAQTKTTSSLLCLFSAPLQGRTYRITSLVYNPCGTDLLVSYSSEHVYLFNMKGGELEKREFKTAVIPPPPEVVVEDKSTPDVSPAHPSDSTSSTGESSNRQPPVKRLRLRGDWSDTGPSARPEGERAATETGRRSPHTTIMQRMSDMLTRWLDGTLRGDAPSESQEATDEQSEAEGNDNTSEVDNTPSHDNIVNEQIQSAANIVSSDVAASDSVPVSDSNEIPSAKILDNVQSSPLCGMTSINEEQSTSAGQTISDKPVVLFLTETDKDSSDHGAGTSENEQICSSTDDRFSISNVAEFQDTGNENQHVSAKKSKVEEEIHTDHCFVVKCESNTHPVHIPKHKCSETSNNFTTPKNISDPSLDHRTIVQCVETKEDCGTNNTDYISSSNSAERVMCSQEGQTVVATTSSSISFVESSCPSTCVDSVLEPVISLQYSSEGTINSSVKVELSSFEMGSCKGPVSKNDHSTVTDLPVSMDTDNPPMPKECDIPVIVTTHASDDNVNEVSESVDRNVCDENFSVSEDCASTGFRFYGGRNPLLSDKENNDLTSTSGMDVDTGDGDSMMHTVEVIPASAGSSAAEESVHSYNFRDKNSSKGKQPVRQRKIGFSGPPTGDFKLSLQDSDSSDEDSDSAEDKIQREIEEMMNYRQSWPRRNTAAYERSQFKPRVRMKYKGHRNARTMIKEANFWGDQYIMSGSDCGHVFIWNKDTAELEMLLEGDKHVVNCLQPNPYFPILASSGIDYDVKIWTPSEMEPKFDEEASAELIRRNEIMLEETRDTITVPAAFMLRVLASLNQVRSGRRAGNRQQNGSGSSSDSD